MRRDNPETTRAESGAAVWAAFGEAALLPQG